MTAHPSPMTLALRFRIYAYCKPRGWDVTIKEIADAIGVSSGMVRATVQHAGWVGRLRCGDGERGDWGAGFKVNTGFRSVYPRDIILGRVGMDDTQ